MNKTVITVLGVSILLGLGPFILDNSTLKTQNLEFKANATAINDTGEGKMNLGVVAEPTLSFGRIPYSSVSIKFLDVNSPREALLEIESSGNISNHLVYSKQTIFNGSKEIDIRFNASEPGYYEGKVHVKTTIPKNEVGKKWFEIKTLVY